MPRAALVEQQPTAATTRFASPQVKAALRRRAAELFGLACALAGLGLLVALGTYDVADPSLSTATSRPAGNLAGPFGAILADLLWQGLGWAALLLPACLLAWAVRLVSRRGLSPLAGRLAAMLAGMPLIAASLTLAPLPPDLPAPAGAGGAIGPVLAGWVMGMAGDNADFAKGAAVLLVLFSLGIGWLALALPRGSMRRGAGAAGVAGRFAGRGAAGGMGWLFRWMRRPERGPDEEAPRMTREAPAPAGRRLEPEPLARPAAPAEPSFAARALGAAGGMLRRAPATPDPRLSALLRNAETAARVPDPVAIPRGDRPRVADRAPPPRKNPQSAQPALDLPDGRYRHPPLSLLTPAPERRDQGPSEEALQNNARMLESVLEDYGVRGRIVEIRPGPVVTLYELEPAPGTKSARVIGLADDIARSMSVLAVRIATVPMRNVIGIEMPNAKRETVYLHELLSAAD